MADVGAVEQHAHAKALRQTLVEILKAGIARAKTTDANSILYMSKANQLYRLTDDEVKGIKAKLLFVPAKSDQIFPPELSRRAAERFRALGGKAEMFEIDGQPATRENISAIINAICNALNVSHMDMPATNEKIWRAANAQMARAAE